MNEKATNEMQEVEEWLKEQISDFTDENGYVEISPCSYDDKFSEETILKAFNEYQEMKDKSEITFYGYLYNVAEGIMSENGALWEPEENIEYEIKCQLRSESPEFQAKYEEYIESTGMEFNEILNEHGYNGATIDLEAFLDNCHINLMFATPEERNFDMGSIISVFHSNSHENPQSFARQSDNALTYLIHQQGHTIAELYEDIFEKGDKRNPEGFIESVAQEIFNEGYCMSELTALTSASGKDLINLLESIAKKEGYICLPQNTEIGLYNEWNGAGSTMEIELEKPFIAP